MEGIFDDGLYFTLTIGETNLENFPPLILYKKTYTNQIQLLCKNPPY